MPVTTKQLLQQLDKELYDIEDKIADLRIDRKATIDAIDEQVPLHKPALALARRLKSMKPAQRSEWLRMFDQYRADLGLDDQLDIEKAA